MILFTPHITNRVKYMAAWMGNYLFGEALDVTDDLSRATEETFFFNYSNQQVPGNNLQVYPSGLLFETGVKSYQIKPSVSGSLLVFFATSGVLGFDVLSAGFYLLSRYEEYLPYTPDEYGRYPHIDSIAFRSGFLRRPLVDEWMLYLKEQLRAAFPAITFKERRFSFLPTYDVDMAWSYKQKGLRRTLGGLAKDLSNFNFSLVKERLDTLSGNAADPFDVFDALEDLHKRYDLQPIFFYLLAARQKLYDKNISPSSETFRQLIRKMAAKNGSGIHPGWQASHIEPLMLKEKQELESITGQPVTANRMHYISFHLPKTFRQLLAIGIKDDYSMGYGSINGFRASTCTPYKWYDLEAEAETDLALHPYAYMEANSIFEEKETPAQALESLQQFLNAVKQVDGTMITIFHNHLIGTGNAGRQWWQVYIDFLAQNFPARQ